MILGKKRMIPVISATSALIKTAAAAKSFTFLICGCFSGETKSANASKEVLISSQMNTKPITTIKEIHSFGEISKIKPNVVAISAAIKWILALCSSIKSIFKPAKA